MQAYLIAIDLDGTTLNNQSQLSPYTIQNCCNKLRNMGTQQSSRHCATTPQQRNFTGDWPSGTNS